MGPVYGGMGECDFWVTDVVRRLMMLLFRYRRRVIIIEGEGEKGKKKR